MNSTLQNSALKFLSLNDSGIEKDKVYKTNNTFVKGIFAVVLLISSFGIRGWGQTISATTYPISPSTGVTLTTYTTIATPISTGVDDGSSGLLNIGFDFWYDGVKYTQFAVNSNGWMKLGSAITGGTGASTYTNNLAQTNVDDPKIAPYWDDLTTGTNGYVRYGVNGTAPNRTLIVEWKTNLVGSGTSALAPIIFQTILSESTGQIQFIYGGTIAANATGYSVGFNKTASIMASVATTSNVVTYGSDPNTTQTTAITAGKSYITTPPGNTSPTGLTFSATTTTGMTLNWTDNSTDEIGFAIYQSTDGGATYTYNSTVAQHTGTGATSAAITGLTANTAYSWKVYAVREALSASSANGSQTTIPGPPGTPTAAAGDAQATVTFTAPAGSAVIISYTVTSSPGGITATGATSPITITGLTNGTPYTFTIKATNAGGTGAASGASSSVTPQAACVAPTAQPSNFVLALIPSAPDVSVNVSYTAAAPVPSGYLIVRYDGASPVVTNPGNGITYAAGNPLGTGTVVSVGTNVSFNSTGLNPSTTYTYYVYDFNNALCSGGPAYNITNAPNGTITTCAAAPVSSAATALTSSGFTANWSASTGASAYVLDVSLSSTFAGFVSGYNQKNVGNVTSFAVTGLASNTQYYYRVRAIGAAGCISTNSLTQTATTPLPACTTPTTPAGPLNFSSITQSSLTGSFTGSGATGYVVIRTTTSTPPSSPVNGTTYTAGTIALGGTVVASGASTTFNDNGLQPSTQYWYWIYPYNNTSCAGGPAYNTTPLAGNTSTSACVVATKYNGY